MKNIKKSILMVLTLTCALISKAQEYNIDFMHDVQWKKVLKQAKKENKPIFVDAYTTWCGPCKVLAKEVFTQKEVADFFNDNFISVKMDMEKGEGIVLKEKWGVHAFPTLLYFNSKGEIVHKVVGSYPANEFLSYSQMSLDENKMSVNLQRRYDEGERTAAFIYDYLVSLRLGYMEALENTVATKYFASLSNEDLLKKENWNIVKNFLNDATSDQFLFLVNNRQKLADLNGAEEVNSKLFKNLNKQLEKWTYWMGNVPFESDKEDKLIGFLQQSDYEKAPFFLGRFLANKYKRTEEKDQYLNTLDYIVKFNLSGGSGTIVSYATNVTDNYTSESAWAKALTWLNTAEKMEKRVEHLPAILRAKSKVFEKLGNKSEAEIAELAAQKADAESEAKGTKIYSIPAFTMEIKQAN